MSAEITVWRSIRASAGWLFLPEVRTQTGDFGFGLSAGWLGACAALWRTSRMSLAPCANIYVGSLHGVVYQLEPTHPGERIVAFVSLRARFDVKIVGPLFGQIGGDLALPLVRQRFIVEGRADPVFDQPSLAGFGFVGLGVSIP